MNLTRSSEYAFLGKPFTLTCTILKPKNISSYVFFKRNTSDKCVGIGIVNGGCRIDSYNSRYAYNCSSENVTTLTIPGSNMTEYEQNSQWHCESVVNSSFRSSSIILKIASKLELLQYFYTPCNRLLGYNVMSHSSVSQKFSQLVSPILNSLELKLQ